jgi:hypothetical protein
MRKKVLIVTPRSPFRGRGADAEERLAGVLWFQRQGFEVRVITKTMPNDVPFVRDAEKRLGIRIVSVPYKFNAERNTLQRAWRLIRRVVWPPFWDGAAYEYFDDEIQTAVRNEIADLGPDLVFFDYSYLWPLYSLPSDKHIPIVTRPINFEPTHFLEEDGRSVANYIKYVPKLLSELIVILKSDLIVALSPYEAGVYRRLGAKRLAVVPLRGLPRVVRGFHEIRIGPPLHVFFMGSTYTVAHNRRALDFVTGTLAPRAEREYPGSFVFHISGAKVPANYAPRFNGTYLINEGFIDEDKFDAYLDKMDVAMSPSPKKVGMQQKVYEPLCRGIPLITARCNTGGYPFQEGVHFLGADTEEEYFNQLVSLRDPALRTALSKNSTAVASELFSEKAYDATLKKSFQTYLGITL